MNWRSLGLVAKGGLVGLGAIALLAIAGAVAFFVTGRAARSERDDQAPEATPTPEPSVTIALSSGDSLVLQQAVPHSEAAEVRRLGADGGVRWAVPISNTCSPRLAVIGEHALIGDCEPTEGGRRPHLVAIALATGAVAWRTETEPVEPRFGPHRRTCASLGDDAIVEMTVLDRGSHIRIRDLRTGVVRAEAEGPRGAYVRLALRNVGARHYIDRADGAGIYLLDPTTAQTTPIAPIAATSVCMTERSVIHRMPDGSVLERVGEAPFARWIAWLPEGSIGCAVDGDRLYLTWRRPGSEHDPRTPGGIETTPMTSPSLTGDGRGALLRYERGVFSWGFVSSWGELDLLSAPSDEHPPPYVRRDEAGRISGHMRSPSTWFDGYEDVWRYEVAIVVDDATGAVSAAEVDGSSASHGSGW
jgi:hypothetical protein